MCLYMYIQLALQARRLPVKSMSLVLQPLPHSHLPHVQTFAIVALREGTWVGEWEVGGGTEEGEMEEVWREGGKKEG